MLLYLFADLYHATDDKKDYLLEGYRQAKEPSSVGELSGMLGDYVCRFGVDFCFALFLTSIFFVLHTSPWTAPWLFCGIGSIVSFVPQQRDQRALLERHASFWTTWLEQIVPVL